jgi:HEAT repeat protein
LTSALSHALTETETISSRDIGSDPERAIDGIVRVLGIIGDPAHVSDIANTLPRSEAVEALAKIGNSKALEAVIAGIPKWYDKYFIELREGSSMWRERELEPVDDFVRKIFGYFGEEGKKELHTALRKGNKETKIPVVKILAALGDPDSVPVLLETLESKDSSTNAEVARALHRLKDRKAVPNMVRELLRTQDHEERTALAKAVLELGSLNDWIEIFFHRPKVELYRGPLFDAAIINSGEEAVPHLTKLLQDSDPDVQRIAAEMIAKIKRGEKASPDPFI